MAPHRRQIRSAPRSNSAGTRTLPTPVRPTECNLARDGLSGHTDQCIESKMAFARLDLARAKENQRQSERKGPLASSLPARRPGWTSTLPNGLWLAGPRTRRSPTSAICWPRCGPSKPIGLLPEQRLPRSYRHQRKLEMGIALRSGGGASAAMLATAKQTSYPRFECPRPLPRFAAGSRLGSS
jgi:hypothetical protein